MSAAHFPAEVYRPVKDLGRALALWPLFHQYMAAKRWKHAEEVMQEIERSVGLRA